MAQMMAGLSKMLAPAMLGMAVGSMVGKLAQRAFGLHDLPIPRDQREIVLVGDTIDSFAAAWEIPIDEMRLWVLAHELCGHVLFSVPHIREPLTDLVRRHVGAFRPDPEAVADKLGPRRVVRRRPVPGAAAGVRRPGGAPRRRAVTRSAGARAGARRRRGHGRRLHRLGRRRGRRAGDRRRRVADRRGGAGVAGSRSRPTTCSSSGCSASASVPNRSAAARRSCRASSTAAASTHSHRCSRRRVRCRPRARSTRPASGWPASLAIDRLAPRPPGPPRRSDAGAPPDHTLTANRETTQAAARPGRVVDERDRCHQADEQIPQCSRDLDHDRHRCRDHPSELEAGLEPGERLAMVGARRLPLHDALERQPPERGAEVDDDRRARCPPACRPRSRRRCPPRSAARGRRRSCCPRGAMTAAAGRWRCRPSCRATTGRRRARTTTCRRSWVRNENARWNSTNPTQHRSSSIATAASCRPDDDSSMR